ncbi:MAG: hypothetical protein QNJ68_10400 [Microcoleaceae cyanobacterium MO_207.B10]|nr:hypothetical protein [Microcoleaceae cyanobacterium MO_207.B10]
MTEIQVLETIEASPLICWQEEIFTILQHEDIPLCFEGKEMVKLKELTLENFYNRIRFKPEFFTSYLFNLDREHLSVIAISCLNPSQYRPHNTKVIANHTPTIKITPKLQTVVYDIVDEHIKKLLDSSTGELDENGFIKHLFDPNSLAMRITANKIINQEF